MADGGAHLFQFKAGCEWQHGVAKLVFDGHVDRIGTQLIGTLRQEVKDWCCKVHVSWLALKCPLKTNQICMVNGILSVWLDCVKITHQIGMPLGIQLGV